MQSKAKLTEDLAWKALQDYYASTSSKLIMKNMFEQDSNRFSKYRFAHFNSENF